MTGTRDLLDDDPLRPSAADGPRRTPLGADGLRDDAHAVIIGIDKYQDPKVPDLRYARADAQAMYDLLTSPSVGRLRPANVTLLLDEAATERGIRTAICTELPRRADPEHTVVVYYAGHGAPVIDPRSRAADGMEKYLVPHDADADNLRASAISMDAVQQFFGWIESRRVVFFIDSCYSGRAGGRSFELAGFRTRAVLSEEFLDGLAGEGRVVMTACAAGEVSLETPASGHGLFTHYVVRGLEGAADADRNGLVTVDELYDYVYRNVERDARALGGSMKPVRKGAVSGVVYLTQYLTAAQRRARELHALAAAALARGEGGEAERLWRDAVAADPAHADGSAALAALLDARAAEARRQAEERERRRELLRGHRNDGRLPARHYEQGLALLDHDAAALEGVERSVRRTLDQLLDGTMDPRTYALVVDRIMGVEEPGPSAAERRAGVEVRPRVEEGLAAVPAGLLDLLHPQQVRPFPSCAVAEMELDPDAGRLSGGFLVFRRSELLSRPMSGVPCRFMTCFDTLLWPVHVVDAEWAPPKRPGVRGGERADDAAGAVRVELRALGGERLSHLAVDPDVLRFFLSADRSVVETLYEVLLTGCARVLVSDPDQPSRAPVVLPAGAVRAAGFADDEALLPYPRRVSRGHALVQELFAFPEKFDFVEVAGVAGALRALDAGERAELHFVVSSFGRPERLALLQMGVGPGTLRLGCTPVVNLFPSAAEPILLAGPRAEYLVIPDLRRREAIVAWSVDHVVAITPGESDVRPVAPLFGTRPGRDDAQEVHWQTVRRPSDSRADGAAELFLSFTDASGRARLPDAGVASLRLTCSNGALPSRLPLGSYGGDFELAQPSPIRRVACLTRPTTALEPPSGEAAARHVLATLALDDLALLDPDAGEALRELLRLHDVTGSPVVERQIRGIAGVRAAADGARGPRVEIELDDAQFVGEGMFLFASVLERLLVPYAMRDGVAQLVVRSSRRERPVREWAAPG